MKIALMIDAVLTTETSVYFYKTLYLRRLSSSIHVNVHNSSTVSFISIINCYKITKLEISTTTSRLHCIRVDG
jgi:hypothetical protein